jgi:hypothetical protein
MRSRARRQHARHEVARREARQVPWGFLLVVSAALLALAVSFILFRGRQAGQPPAGQMIPAQAGVAAGIGEFVAAMRRDATALGLDVSSRWDGDSASAEPTMPATTADPDADGVDAAHEGTTAHEGATAGMPVSRTVKPLRHEDIASRLGWAAGDARTDLLATWLEGGELRRDADLVALFGPADAAAITRELAPSALLEH